MKNTDFIKRNLKVKKWFEETKIYQRNWSGDEHMLNL